MKVFFKLFVAAMAISATVVMPSCSKDEAEDAKENGKTEEQVEMGSYKLSFEDLDVEQWPDTESDVQKRYEAYQKKVTEALNLDLSKKYKWSEIEADKERLQSVFDSLDDFEYKVESCLNYFHHYYGTTLKAMKTNSEYADIDFGAKKLVCTRNIPADVLSQVVITMKSNEASVPSSKEYCTNLRNQFTNALKEFFSAEYGVKESTRNELVYSNLANFKDNSDDFYNSILSACKTVDIPTLAGNIKEDAQNVLPVNAYIFQIDVIAYNPWAPAPTRSDKVIFTYTVKIQ